jgi:MFS family permease
VSTPGGTEANGVRTLLASALGTAGLRRLALAWTLSALGAWSFTVALSVYAYRQGGATAVGLAALARMLPAGLAAPFTGLLGDRRSRRDVLVGLSAGRALALGGAAGAAAAGSLPLVLLLAAVFTVLQTGHRPTQAALAPGLATSPRQLAAANAVWNGAENAAFLGGSLLGGVAVAATSVPAGLVATSVAFVAATVAVSTLPRDPVPAHRVHAAPGGVAREALAGLATVGRDRGLRVVVALRAVSTLVEGAVDVLIVVVALEGLDLGASGVGWLNSAWGLGGLAGGVAALALLGRGRLASGLAGGALLVGGALAVVAAATSTPVALAMLVVLGVGYTLIEVAGDSLVQRLASEHVLARAFGVSETSYWVTNGVGSVLAPVLIHLLGLRGALVAVGALLPAVAVSRWAALARLEAGAPVPEREFALLRRLPFGAPLPLSTLETLARQLVPVPVAADEAVVRQGHPAHRFYVVAEGRVRITVDGVERCVQGPGDFFGEIALLRDVPRTATVTATEDGLLLALGREDFLRAVTGHAQAGGAADAVVAARLSPVEAAR